MLCLSQIANYLKYVQMNIVYSARTKYFRARTGLHIRIEHVTRKPVFEGFQPGYTVSDQVTHKMACSATETSWSREILYSCSMYMYCTIYAVNKKDADQTARVRGLFCAFVVRIWHKTGFLITGRGSSIGNEFAWHASGPEFDPHVRHILSWETWS